MSLFGDFEHHLHISVGNYIPNSWVMFNWDIYQPQKVYIPLYPIIVPLFTINIPLNPTKSPLNHPVIVVVLQASNPLVTGLDQGSSTVASPKILLGGFTRKPPTKHEKLDWLCRWSTNKVFSLCFYNILYYT